MLITQFWTGRFCYLNEERINLPTWLASVGMALPQFESVGGAYNLSFCYGRSLMEPNTDRRGSQGLNISGGTETPGSGALACASRSHSRRRAESILLRPGKQARASGPSRFSNSGMLRPLRRSSYRLISPQEGTGQGLAPAFWLPAFPLSIGVIETSSYLPRSIRYWFVTDRNAGRRSRCTGYIAMRE